MAAKSPKDLFPVHWLVWHNDYAELDRLLASNKSEIETEDPHGRTPLHLAVTLCHLECTRVLLRHGANAGAENGENWTVIQEAVSTGDPEILQLSLQNRDFQRYTRRTEGVPGLLQKLREAPDFYVEMKWEFASWVPLVSRVCPSDTYKVWKSGSNVRIDTTLLGFDNMNWQRGSRSYIFKGQVDSAVVLEIDHDMHQVFTETMQVLPEPPDISFLSPSEDAVAARLTSPIVTTYIDTEKIAFERNKSGIWGWRSDKSEAVNGYECKVFSATNVEFVTKTRTEHLTEQDKERTKKINRHPLESLLGMAEQEDKAQGASNGDISSISHNPCSITPEDYFNRNVDLKGKDIGRPKEQTTKTQKFKANLWLSEKFPLLLQDQVLPIIDLMAASNAHFKKLKDFITLQLPSGFPVKIEIPLFHVLNARITFGNIHASETPVTGVTNISGDGIMYCAVEEASFDPPASYSRIGDMRHERVRDEDDEILQFAIQQSLMEAGTENDQEFEGDEDQVTFWEALNKAHPKQKPPLNIRAEEERLLQRALEESLHSNQSGLPADVSTENSRPPLPPPPPRYRDIDSDLELALQLSKQEMQDAENRQKQEQDELERILKLSLTEK